MARAVTIRTIVGTQRLKALNARSNGPGLVFLAGHLATTAVTGWLLWLSLGGLWAIPATVVHGIVLVHWFSPFHETSHRTAFSTGWLNSAVNWLSGLILGLNPTYFVHEHARHHAFTQDPGKDPQYIPHTDTLGGYLLYATGLPYFRSLLRDLVLFPLGLFSAQVRDFTPQAALPRIRRDGQIMAGVYLAVAAGSVWFGSWGAVVYWLLPRFAGEPVMRLIRMSEHGGCAKVPDMLRNTRTVLTAFLPRWLAWNNAYHAEHHNSPVTPFHALPRLHLLLAPHLAELTHGYVETQGVLIRRAAGRHPDASAVP